MSLVESIEILQGFLVIRIRYAIARLLRTRDEDFPFRPLSPHLADKLKIKEGPSAS